MHPLSPIQKQTTEHPKSFVGQAANETSKQHRSRGKKRNLNRRLTEKDLIIRRFRVGVRSRTGPRVAPVTGNDFSLLVSLNLKTKSA